MSFLLVFCPLPSSAVIVVSHTRRPLSTQPGGTVSLVGVRTKGQPTAPWGPQHRPAPQPHTASSTPAFSAPTSQSPQRPLGLQALGQGGRTRRAHRPYESENRESKARLPGQWRLTIKSKGDISKGRERFSYSHSEQDNRGRDRPWLSDENRTNSLIYAGSLP